ncbi:MAG: YihY/virulence factor BrkB family protein [Ignavibacteriaceae bacterium]
MNKKSILQRIYESNLYRRIRKLKLVLQYIPTFKKIKNFVVYYFGGLIQRTDEHHAYLLAGGLAFSLFVCIIPFVLIIFSLLGNILNSHNMQFQINSFIDTIIPYDNYSELAKKLIFSRINEVIQYKNIAGIVGGFGLLFAASGLFSSMRTILNKVFGAKGDESYLWGKLKDFALVFMVILIFLLTTILTPLLDIVKEITQQFNILHFLEVGIFEHFIISVISLILIFIVFSILYFTVPIIKIRKSIVFISAFWAAILWEAAKLGFGYYLNHFKTWGEIYGTYTFLVVIAFWIYYSSIVFIIGAEIGRLYDDRKILSQDIKKKS